MRVRFHHACVVQGRGLYKEEAKAKMRMLPDQQKYMLIQQDIIRNKGDLLHKVHTPAYFAKLLAGQRPAEASGPTPQQLQRGSSLLQVAPGSASKNSQQQQGPTLKDLQELHVLLRGALKDWLLGFVQEGALDLLLDLLSPEQ